MSKHKRQRPIKISFTRKDGEDSVKDYIYLNRNTEPSLVAIVRRIVRESFASDNSGYIISERTRKDIENLPCELYKKLANKRVPGIERKQTERIPKLSAWINFCYESGKISSVDCRKLRDIVLRYHEDIRLDEISVKDAEGFRAFLSKATKLRGRGAYAKATINKAISLSKRIFRYAIKAGHLKSNPYEDVVAGGTSNPDNYYFVSKTEWQKVADLIPTDTVKHLELRLIFALSRWAGLRIPSEIRDLKKSSFTFKENGDGSFEVPVSGKTGLRAVPVFPELVPHYKVLVSAIPAGQEYLFEHYRQCTNLGEVIKDYVFRAGLEPWPVFMHNQRRSFIKDLVDKGWSEHDITCVCGNTQEVRRLFYYFKRTKDELATMGGAGGSTTGAPPSAPHFDLPFPPEGNDPAELKKWEEAVVAKAIYPFTGGKVSASEVVESLDSSYEIKMAMNEVNAMFSTFDDFFNGKITIEEGDERIDDGSYRALLFRDKYVKKSLREIAELKEKEGGNAPPLLGDTGLEPVTPSLSS